MALSLGLYDKIIGSVSNLFKNFKKSVLTLLPILLGCVLGIVGIHLPPSNTCSPSTPSSPA